MRPLIGITTSELRPSGASTLRRQGEPPHPEMALGITYAFAIERAGGVPVVLPPVIDDVEPLLHRLDGVCLSGGPDLDPEAYGARERHAELGPTEPSLDTFELALARGALARRLPLLGDLPRRPGDQRGLRRHAAPAPARPPPVGAGDGHDARGRGAARHAAAALVGAGTMAVNSFHHQAVDRSAAACGSPPAPPTAPSRRSRAPASSSACSGTRRRSPTGGCSRPSRSRRVRRSCAPPDASRIHR